MNALLFCSGPVLSLPKICCLEICCKLRSLYGPVVRGCEARLILILCVVSNTSCGCGCLGYVYEYTESSDAKDDIRDATVETKDAFLGSPMLSRPLLRYTMAPCHTHDEQEIDSQSLTSFSLSVTCRTSVQWKQKK